MGQNPILSGLLAPSHRARPRKRKTNNLLQPPDVVSNQGCAWLMSREWNLTRLWIKWVESELSRPRKSTIWVETESNHADRTLSHSWVNCIPTAWVKVESPIFLKRKRSDCVFSPRVTGKEPTHSHNRGHPPAQQLLAKLAEMRWVVSQIWLNSDWNELSQSSVRLTNLGFELNRSWVNLEK